MKTQLIPIEKIRPNTGQIEGLPKNPRFIRDHKFEKLKQSIFDLPAMLELREVILFPFGDIFVTIGGNMRYRACVDLNYSKVPAKVLPADTPVEVLAEIAIKDNGDFGENDWDILANEWDTYDLEAWGVDVQGFEEVEPAGEADAEPQIDKAAELNKKWGVVSGDLWQIGEHRLLCGDSTLKDDVTRLMGQEKAVLMNTDPPYGIAYVKNANSKDQAEAFDDIANDDLDGEMLQEFLENCIRAALDNLEPNAAFYLWHPMLTQGTFFAAAAAAADILIHRQIIWIKPSMVFGRGDYHWQHELAFYGWVRGNRPPFYGERNQTTFWAMGRENDNIHPTQKPIELFIRPINNHTKRGELIYEPFAGSGSQFVAAENTKRKCYGMELSPDYCGAILERMATAFPDIEIKRIDG